MRKNFLKISLLAALGLVSVVFTSCKDNELKEQPTPSDPKTTDAGVVINGVTWATRNVDAFGTFAKTPESAGMFYQWNRPKAWADTGAVIDWDASYFIDKIWKEANDPSPKGWRVPTKEELQSLLDTEKVTNKWTTQNGINGRKFTDKVTGASLFFPAVGRRDPIGGLGGTNSGYYWSCTPRKEPSPFDENAPTEAYYCAYFLSFDKNKADEYGNLRSFGLSIRPVLAE